MLASRLLEWRSRDTGHRVCPGPLLGAALLAVMLALFSVTPLGHALEQRFGLWMLVQLRQLVARPEPPSEVVIIAMRRDTGQRISLLRRRNSEEPCVDLQVDRYPLPPGYDILGDVPERWGRCHHVELLKRLVLAQPRLVVFDVVFRPRSDISRAEDRALARSMRTAGNVLVAQSLDLGGRPKSQGPDWSSAWEAVRATQGRASFDAGEIHDAPVVLSREIAAASLGAAPTPVPWHNGGRVDRFELCPSRPGNRPGVYAAASPIGRFLVNLLSCIIASSFKAAGLLPWDDAWSFGFLLPQPA